MNQDNETFDKMATGMAAAMGGVFWLPGVKKVPDLFAGDLVSDTK